MKGLRSGTQVLLEEGHGALPGQGCGGLVVARCGVVVKTVLGIRIHIRLGIFSGSFEGIIISFGSGINPFVIAGVVNKQRRLNGGNLGQIALPTVK